MLDSVLGGRGTSAKNCVSCVSFYVLMNLLFVFFSSEFLLKNIYIFRVTETSRIDYYVLFKSLSMMLLVVEVAAVNQPINLASPTNVLVSSHSECFLLCNSDFDSNVKFFSQSGGFVGSLFCSVGSIVG